MTGGELEAHRLHVALLDILNEMRLREIVHKTLPKIDGNICVVREYAIVTLLVVGFAANTGSLAGVANIAVLREMLEHLLLHCSRPRGCR